MSSKISCFLLFAFFLINNLTIIYCHVDADNISTEYDEFNCTKLPPALWCASDAIQQKCGFDIAKCKQHEDGVRNQKVQITMLYESLCDGCSAFLTKTLLPAYYEYSSFVELKLVPFGNAKLLPDGTIRCQHGHDECKANKLESCALHFLDDPFHFVGCLEKQLNGGNNGTLDNMAKQCATKSHLDPKVFDLINNCSNGPLGDQLQKLASNTTANVWPDKHKYVPWVLFNGASIESQQTDLREMLAFFICQTYVGDGKEYCAYMMKGNNNNTNKKKKGEDVCFDDYYHHKY